MNTIERKKVGRILTFAVFIGAATVFLLLRSGKETSDVYLLQEDGAVTEANTFSSPEENEETASSLFVYVTGAVNKEGVYAVDSSSRIFEVIRLAGGLSIDADTERINQAEYVRDGMHLHIPHIGEDSGITDFETVASGGLVDINSAGMEDLLSLKGIGQAKAEAIIEYRKKNGSFRSVEELLNVPGIGQTILNDIREKIRV